MSIDGISTQTPLPPPPVHPSAPRSVPSPTYDGLEDIKNLRIEEGDIVKISGDANELNAGRSRQTIGTDQLSATSKQGTRIDVIANTDTPPTLSPAFPSEKADSSPPNAPVLPPSYSVSLTRQDGNALNIDFSQDVRIHEANDGITSVYFSATNKTRTYDVDGAFTEIDGNALDSTADAIIINTSGKTVQGGNGDNLIFNFANDTEILGGSGNDTIILADRDPPR